MHPDRVGPYRIERELGRGGMGEVFLATDSRLDRQVAVKALPAHLANEPDRLARFQREAKVLASLNHPGIAALYGLEEAAGHHYLILEFVEGETLADRVVSGAVPVEEALSIARQIAEAVEAAHERGVIHRDLKPANVMVTPHGVVKVLDFGLARTADGTPSTTSAPVPPDSPTLTSPARAHSPTIPGAIMGTAGYMSPEQARGKPVDKRSDIFSFGCLLFEMLSGAQPFPGETVTDSLGAILHREPDWALLPQATPPRVRELLKKCLAKDRRSRLHDIADARLDLERAVAGQEWVSASAQSRGSGRRVPVAILLAAALVAAGWGLAQVLDQGPPRLPSPSFHLSALIDKKPAFRSLVAIDPEARFVVYTASPERPPESAKPEGVLMVRRLDREEVVVIEGTEGAREAALSSDGRWIAFTCAQDRAWSKWGLKKVALESGRPTGKPETVCELAPSGSMALCWASDREIAFAPDFGGVIYAVSASGGEPRVLIREESPSAIESWADLRPLVPGRSILATRWSLVGQKVKLNTEVIDLSSGKRTLVFPDAGFAHYAPNDGCLIAMRGSTTSLIAVPFDPRTLRTRGEPVTVWSGNPINAFRIASSGTLALATRPIEVPDRRLAWIDEKGQPEPIPGMMRSYGEVCVSPDGGRVSLRLDSPASVQLESDTWVQDFARRNSVRIPIQGAMIRMVWSNDSQYIAYGLAKDDGFSIWQQRADGSGTAVKLVSSPDSRSVLAPSAWTPDGKFLAYVQVDLTADNADAYLLERDAASSKWTPRPYMKTLAQDEVVGFSPDGKWVLFRSSQSGRTELYVQRFTGDGEADAGTGRHQVSSSGASGPRPWWSPDGKEIRYTDADLQLVSVRVTTEPAFSVGESKVLCSIKDLKTRDTTFAPDGRLMAVLQGESEQITTSVDLVVNFLDEVRAKFKPAK